MQHPKKTEERKASRKSLTSPFSSSGKWKHFNGRLAHEEPMIYLDNAATSFPKPQSVVDAVSSFMTGIGANPGRSGHRLSVEAEKVRIEARERIARLFNGTDPLRVVFTANVTHAINLVLFGSLKAGDRVVTTAMEHNAVMRPLRLLESRGVKLVLVAAAPDGMVDPADFDRELKKGARLACALHASNAFGTIMPIGEIGRLCRRRSVPFMVDAAQTAGSFGIDMERDNIDILAFTGHKGLLGPTGTGGLVLGPNVDEKSIAPLVLGGTGSRSDTEVQPDFLPDRFESGTANIVGIAGLSESVRWVTEKGVDAIRAREMGLAERLISGLIEIPAVTVYGTRDMTRRTAAVSFRVAGIDNAEVSARLCDDFDIMCRAGLHCAPRAHTTMGTFPGGTVRLSIGPFNTEADIDAAVRTVEAIARKK
jgi:cysteine desulfurase family protein